MKPFKFQKWSSTFLFGYKLQSFEIELRFLDWTEYSVWHKINLICSTREKNLALFRKMLLL